MNFFSFLPWNGVKLDPARTRAARHHFDTAGGYEQWHMFCREAVERPVPGGAPSIEKTGMEVVTLLQPSEAAAAKALLLGKAKQFQQKKKAIDYADVLAFEDADFLLPLMEKMLNPEIDAKIRQFFGSEYFVQGLVANRTMPSRESKRSFLWHCDRGPQNFLKINLFLDATADHGGTTEFLDIADSKVFEDAGYTFGANDRRVSDLSAISRKIGANPKIARPELDAGQAFMFLPARSLHRGFLPSKGIRHMLLAIILPSPIHWRQAWDKMAADGSLLQGDGSFPDKADDLSELIGVERPGHRVAA